MVLREKILPRIWLPVSLVLLWEGLARAGWVNPIFFPPPTRLVAEGLAMIRSGELPGHLWSTLIRTFEGSALGIVTGLACGTLMGLSRPARRALEPLVSALAASPKIALFPVLMLVLGIGQAPRIALIAAAAFVMAALPILDGVRNLDVTYVELARNYGARSWKLVSWVYLPGSLPHLLTAARLALSRALGVCVAVEVVNARNGLGSLIWAGWQSFRPEHVYIGVLTAAALGATLHASMRLLEKALVPWKA
ncbi:MAG TPA: ABC transporter permease [Bryobacteraceae bacterium]|jgi:ABC-type nitrate/sulfonate/bicarbonate transport system permease component